MENKKPQQIVKEAEVASLSAAFAENNGVILADYRGLTVAEVTQLRANLRKAGVTYKVAKNTLIRRAAEENNISSLNEFLEGPTAIAFSKEPAQLAKIMSDFAKDHKALELKAGLCDGEFMDAQQLVALSKIPSREVLLAQIAGGMLGVVRNFVYALNQIAEKQGAEQPAAE